MMSEFCPAPRDWGAAILQQFLIVTVADISSAPSALSGSIPIMKHKCPSWVAMAALAVAFFGLLSSGARAGDFRYPFRGSNDFGIGVHSPSYYGYNLDEMNAGYYGGGRYRGYYSYGRGYGIPNYPVSLPRPGFPAGHPGSLARAGR